MSRYKKITWTFYIYKIINLVNKREYIGVSRNIGSRMWSHISALNGNGLAPHPSKDMIADFKSHGMHNFALVILERFTSNKAEAIRREKEYILKSINPYNIRIPKTKPINN